MKRVLFMLALFTGFSYALEGLEGEVSLGALSLSPSGYIQYQGDRVDVKGDMALGRETKPFARMKLELPVLPNLYLQYIPMSFKGEADRSFTYGGVTFNGRIKSSVRLNHYDLGLYYNLPFLGIATGGILDPELGVNLRVIGFKGTVTEVNTGTTEPKSLTTAIPMAYVGVGVDLSYVKLLGELRGITYSGHLYYDVTGEVRLKPISIPLLGSLFVGLGYRYERLKLDNLGDVNSDIKIKGLFGNVGVAF